MGTLAGFYPFRTFDRSNAKQVAAVVHFLKNGEAFGNMYSTGKRICPWYAATMAMASLRAGRPLPAAPQPANQPATNNRPPLRRPRVARGVGTETPVRTARKAAFERCASRGLATALPHLLASSDIRPFSNLADGMLMNGTRFIFSQSSFRAPRSGFPLLPWLMVSRVRARPTRGGISSRNRSAVKSHAECQVSLTVSWRIMR